MTGKQLKMFSRGTVPRNRIEPTETEKLPNSQNCLITLYIVRWVIKQNAQVYQKQKTGDVVVSHRHATIANALIHLIGDNNVFYFQTMIVFRKILLSIAKKCNFAIKNDIFYCRKRSFAFLKNFES